MDRLDKQLGLRRLLGLESKHQAFSQWRALIPAAAAAKFEKHIAESVYFNGVIILCILVDSVVVGVEIDHSNGESIEDRLPYFLLDTCFVMVFVFEMVARMHQQGWEYFADAWNIFDYICVSVGVSSLLTPSAEGASDAVNLRIVKALKGFRVLRLLRVVRHIGGLKIVEGLFLLVAGLMNSVKTLFWVAIFLFLMIYCFGVALVTLSDVPALHVSWEEADVYVGGVSKAMLTIWQVCTFDAWASDIARPLFMVAPAGGAVLIIAIVIITFGTLNVVLAVMVEHVRKCMDDRNKRMARKLEETDNFLLSRVSSDFKSAKADDFGRVRYEDFCKLLKNEQFLYKLRLLGVPTTEADQLFHLVDADESGMVTCDEFVHGLRRRKGVATGTDLVKTICYAQKECSRARKYAERVRRLSDLADVMQRRLNSMGAGMTAELTQRQEVEMHADEVKLHAAEVEEIVKKMAHVDRVTFPSLAKESYY